MHLVGFGRQEYPRVFPFVLRERREKIRGLEWCLKLYWSDMAATSHTWLWKFKLFSLLRFKIEFLSCT